MHSRLIWVMPPVLMAPAFSVHAVQYLDVAQAQKALFPSATNFVQTPVVLTDAQRSQLKSVSGTSTPPPSDQIWKVMNGETLVGWFLVDQVLGKHELITYAAAIAADGTMAGLEIMEYRETRGGEVRDPAWRAHFHGKRAGDALKLDEDIPNISGATLSCKHLSEGARRLLALHALALKP